MVFFYTPREDGYVIFVGRDKHENEELLKYGWNTDVWFHVDKLSSAHVYLRLPDGVTIDTIDAGVLEDCAQLVKHNSIEGNRTNGVIIVYTGWANLKKSGDMATGQVGFHGHKAVHRTRVDKRDNAIVNRLNKTKAERFPDLAEEKESYERGLARAVRVAARKREQEERALAAKRAREKSQRSYTLLQVDEKKESNKDIGRNFDEFEDDFM
ncbi:hypothetical protein BU14_0141s0005 [Porphyra umbilicalis]|uniref:NFACT RNA-binding domain-containing protein n=1 Tax=Porphyra umbilicalis TaxID=2786 RepID=A0A1X6P9P9_PORUM|nr:hypothetical protein BU14_0141s0005 [Porphyra umbilicalis]|eukprot:OSX77621.1 hypothetical protein BU14_0141s0005 [Porphyra umbilicalis]